MPLLSVACCLLPPQISIDMYSAVLAKHCDVRWQPLTTAVGDPAAQVPHNAHIYALPSAILEGRFPSSRSHYPRAAVTACVRVCARAAGGVCAPTRRLCGGAGEWRTAARGRCVWPMLALARSRLLLRVPRATSTWSSTTWLALQTILAHSHHHHHHYHVV